MTEVNRISSSSWVQMRAVLLAHDPDAARMVEWSESLSDVAVNPDSLAFETVWIILCAGKKAQAARTIERRVLSAIGDGRPVVDVYGHRGRAFAIEQAWSDRDQRYCAFLNHRADVESLYAWCKSLPWVGPVTSFQLMKNLGVDCCKPDIWLCRLAGIPDKSTRDCTERFRRCMRLCDALARVTGDRVATVDSLLWLGCNKGLIRVSPDAGPVTFSEHASTHSSVF